MISSDEGLDGALRADDEADAAGLTVAADDLEGSGGIDPAGVEVEYAAKAGGMTEEIGKFVLQGCGVRKCGDQVGPPVKTVYAERGIKSSRGAYRVGRGAVIHTSRWSCGPDDPAGLMEDSLEHGLLP